jgi:hypothetical protein
VQDNLSRAIEAVSDDKIKDLNSMEELKNEIFNILTGLVLLINWSYCD